MKRFTPITATSRLVCSVAIGLLSLTGCAPLSPTSAVGSAADDEDTQELLAQERVADLARDISTTRPDDIDGWARAAVANSIDESDSIELIGIDSQQSGDPSRPFGRLTLRVPTPEFENAPTGTLGAYCFEVEFDYYGKVGMWESSDGVDRIDCPVGAVIVVPPVDDTLLALVPVNAREVTTAVLLERARSGMPATADAITAAISARLESPTGQFEVAAPPRVVVEEDDAGGRVGVAFGSAEDCVLVKSENGTVEDVYPAPIKLMPGELGCEPDTALTDPDQLRSPH